MEASEQSRAKGASSTSGPSRRILVFGASGHIGGPLARFVRETSPRTALRLATSSPAKAGVLQRTFPGSEVVVASYFNEADLRAAVADVEGVFVLTPDFLDEITAMSNFVAAAKAAGTVRRIVRVLADMPGMTLAKLPRELRELGPGPAVQHFEARAILTASGLPVTFLNSAGYYMDDFLIHFAPPLKREHRLVVPYDRLMCFTDTTDLGQVAARLLLAEDERHVGQYYHFNSGEDPILFSQVAAVMSEVLQRKIEYDGDPQAFIDKLGPALRQITGDDRAARYFVVNWRMERDQHAALFGSPFGESILGRKPTSLRQWLEANRSALLAP